MITHEPVKGFYSIVTLDEKKIVTKRISDVYQNLYQHPPSSLHQYTSPSSLHQFTSPSLITSTHLPHSSPVHISLCPHWFTSSHLLTSPHHHHRLASPHHSHLLTSSHHPHLLTSQQHHQHMREIVELI